MPAGGAATAAGAADAATGDAAATAGATGAAAGASGVPAGAGASAAGALAAAAGGAGSATEVDTSGTDTWPTDSTDRASAPAAITAAGRRAEAARGRLFGASLAAAGSSAPLRLPRRRTTSNSALVTGWTDNRLPFFVTIMSSSPLVAFSVASAMVSAKRSTNSISTMCQSGFAGVLRASK